MKRNQLIAWILSIMLLLGAFPVNIAAAEDPVSNGQVVETLSQAQTLLPNEETGPDPTTDPTAEPTAEPVVQPTSTPVKATATPLSTKTKPTPVPSKTAVKKGSSTPKAVKLAAPGAPSIARAGTTGLKISWSKVKGAEAYWLYRSTSAKSGFKLIVKVTDQSYIDTNVKEGTTYYYRLRAYANPGKAVYSPNGLARGGALMLAPSKLYTTPISDSSVKVSWPAVSGATEYQLFRATSEKGKYTRIYSGKTRNYTDTGLKNGISYYYKVMSLKTIESKKYTSLYSAVKRGVAMAAPALPNASMVGDTGIKLTWKAVKGADGYQLYRATAEKGSYSLIWSGSGLTYTDIVPKIGTTYYYKLRVYILDSSTKVYGPFSKVRDSVVLQAPANITTAGAGSTTVKISWSGVTGAGGYELFRTTEEKVSYKKMYSGSAKSYTNSGLNSGEVYYYRARAYKTLSGVTYYGPYSDVKPGFSLAAPTVTTSTVNLTSLKVTWTAVAGADAYQLYRSTSASGSYSLVTSGSDRSYTDSPVSSGTAYYYKTRAFVEIDGQKIYGPFSAVKGGVALDSPMNVNAKVYGVTSVKVTWKSVLGATEYEVQRATGDAGSFVRVYTGEAKSYVDKNLAGGVDYRYRVRAVRTFDKETVIRSTFNEAPDAVRLEPVEPGTPEEREIVKQIVSVKYPRYDYKNGVFTVNVDFRNSSNKNVKAPMLIDIIIVNNSSKTVYNRTHTVTMNDFDSNNSAVITIKASDIKKSEWKDGGKGILTYRAYYPNLKSFSESAILINGELPHAKITDACSLKLPTLPKVLNYYDVNITIQETIRVDSAKVTFTQNAEESSRVNLTVSLSGKKIYGAGKTEMRIMYTLKKDGSTVQSGKFWNSAKKIEIGNFTDISHTFYNLEPGDYVLELGNVID